MLIRLCIVLMVGCIASCVAADGDDFYITKTDRDLMLGNEYLEHKKKPQGDALLLMGKLYNQGAFELQNRGTGVFLLDKEKERDPKVKRDLKLEESSLRSRVFYRREPRLDITGKVNVAFSIPDRYGILARTQSSLQKVFYSYPEFALTLFEKFHATAVYTQADNRILAPVVTRAVDRAVGLHLSRYPLYGDTAFAVQVASGLKLFGAPGVGKKFIGIPINSVDPVLSDLATTICAHTQTVGGRCGDGQHISIGSVETSSVEENQLLEDIVRDILVAPFTACVTKLRIMGSWHSPHYRYRIGGSYKDLVASEVGYVAPIESGVSMWDLTEN